MKAAEPIRAGLVTLSRLGATIAALLFGSLVLAGPAGASQLGTWESEGASVDPADSQGPNPGEAECADPHHPGGEWPSLNHDLHNTRHQDREDLIGVEEAPALAPAWQFSVAEAGAEGSLQSTPIVANGCVYVSASVGLELSPGQFDLGGMVFALNADTGELVWQAPLNGSGLGLAAADGLIFALPTGAAEAGAPSGFPEPRGAHAVALDADTGEMVWSSDRLDGPDDRHGKLINASPVVFTPSMKMQGRGKGPRRSMLFVPLSGASGDRARVPLYFLDARTGKVIQRFFALPEEDYEAGYGGTGIWTTAAFDETTNHLYAGTADSEGHRYQHPYNNAILKIDGDPKRKSFASVVGAYSGTSEHYDLDRHLPGWENNPVCESDAELPNPVLPASQAVECLELDLDFGASPNLLVDGPGSKLVAAQQKSGVLHVLSADSMEARWTKVLSAPNEVSNAATAAVAGEKMFVKSTPNTVFSLDGASGSLRWASSTVSEAFTYQPLTAANGVIYTITNVGYLVAFDAETGRMLLNRPIFLDVAQSCLGDGAGVALARNTVYAPCDAGVHAMPGAGPGALVAYRPPRR